MNCKNPKKYEFLTFNSNEIKVIVYGENLNNLGVVKYLGIHIGGVLNHIDHIKVISQRIGIYKNIVSCLPINVAMLYNNSFI